MRIIEQPTNFHTSSSITILSLPEELRHQIIFNLNESDCYSVSQVSKLFYKNALHVFKQRQLKWLNTILNLAIRFDEHKKELETLITEVINSKKPVELTENNQLKKLHEDLIRSTHNLLIKETPNDAKSLIIDVIQSGSFSIIRLLTGALLDDEEILTTILQKDGFCLRNLPHIQDNEKYVGLAIQQEPLSLQYASKRLKSSKKIVFYAVNKDARAIEYANEELKNDPDLKEILSKNRPLRLVIEFIGDDILEYNGNKKIKKTFDEIDREIAFLKKILFICDTIANLWKNSQFTFWG